MSVYTWQTDPAQSWRSDALCADMDPALWDLDQGSADELREGAAVCADCPVRAQCLAEAFELRENATIRGGMSFDFERPPPEGVPSAWGIRRRSLHPELLLHERQKITCPVCEREVWVAKNGNIMRHAPKGKGRDSQERHDQPRKSGDICSASGQRAKIAS